MTRISYWKTALLCVLLGGASCRSEPAASAPPKTQAADAPSAPAAPEGKEEAPNLPLLKIRTQSGKELPIYAELARTQTERTQGLMHRKHLADNRGMLFFMGYESIHSFWMKNTLISLDMLFLDPQGVVVGIVERAEPETLDPRRVDRPSLYVLELAGGACERHGIRPGDQVELDSALAWPKGR